jgi:hypothetical protein
MLRLRHRLLQVPQVLSGAIWSSLLLTGLQLLALPFTQLVSDSCCHHLMLTRPPVALLVSKKMPGYMLAAQSHQNSRSFRAAARSSLLSCYTGSRSSCCLPLALEACRSLGSSSQALHHSLVFPECQ